MFEYYFVFCLLIYKGIFFLSLQDYRLKFYIFYSGIYFQFDLNYMYCVI